MKKKIKLYRGQQSGKVLKANGGDSSNNIGNALYFTTDENIARIFGNQIIEIECLENEILTIKEINKIIKDAQIKLDELVKNGIYEGEEYEKYESLAIGYYNDIARITGKPFIETEGYDNTEILYYPEMDFDKKRI